MATAGRVLVAAVAAATGACATLPPPPPPPAAAEIREDLAYLADPARLGRELGTAGRDSATAWIAARFEAAGLEPLFGDACAARDGCPPGGWASTFPVYAPMMSGTGVNVAGKVPGTAPGGRVLVVGAHYDHIGRNAGLSRDAGIPGLRPGADDNASGTAALLELARRIAARPLPVTVVFVAFDAEELGLHGSRRFLTEPPVPPDSMLAMVNLDMVGRMRWGELAVRGVGSAPWWRQVVEGANTDGLRLSLEHGGGSSDHVSFREAEVPAIHLYTGTHPDYHRRSDIEERINYLGIVRVVDLAERVARSLAARESRGHREATGADSVHPAIGAFARRLEADAAADGAGAVSAAVVAGDRVVWSGGFGAVDPGSPEGAGEAASAATIYRVGSITKTVTALALVRLAERGVVRLEDEVAEYVPEIAGLAGFQATWRPITLADLASHTAGLEREPGWSRAGVGRREGWRGRVLRSIPVTSMRSRPGAAYHYSNIGYGILGLALERATGRPFEALVVEEVLAPLGMEDSGFDVEEDDRDRLAVGTVNVEEGVADPRVPRAEHRGRGYRLPGEGLYSTVTDLARLVMALSGALGDVYLGPAARALLLTDRSPDGDGRSGYGLGVQLTRLGGTLVAGHSGTAPGYASYLAFDPVSGAGVVILRGYNRGATNLGAEAQGLVLELAR